MPTPIEWADETDRLENVRIHRGCPLTNEAAERLLAMYTEASDPWTHEAIKRALAEEHKATVERISGYLNALAFFDPRTGTDVVQVLNLFAMLDAEAAR